MKSGYLQNPTFFVDAQLKVSLPAQGAISNATNVSPFWGLRFAYPPCIDCLRCGGKLREGLTMVALRVAHPTRTSNGATRGALLSCPFNMILPLDHMHVHRGRRELHNE